MQLSKLLNVILNYVKFRLIRISPHPPTLQCCTETKTKCIFCLCLLLNCLFLKDLCEHLKQCSLKHLMLQQVFCLWLRMPACLSCGVFTVPLFLLQELTIRPRQSCWMAEGSSWSSGKCAWLKHHNALTNLL